MVPGGGKAQQHIPQMFCVAARGCGRIKFGLLRSGKCLAASAPAITDKGLSLPADSAAFAAMTAFLKSFESAAGVMKIAIADLK